MQLRREQVRLQNVELAPTMMALADGASSWAPGTSKYSGYASEDDKNEMDLGFDVDDDSMDTIIDDTTEDTFVDESQSTSMASMGLL